jgi:hypothetical protein
VYNIDIMSKNNLICFRVSAEEKARIETAANEQGESLTTFIKVSVMATVHEVESRSSNPIKPRHRHQGITQWLRNLCEEATKGGALGFREVGERFSWSVHFRYQTEYSPDVAPADEWGTILKEFDRLLTPALKNRPDMLLTNEDYNEKVWSFLVSHFSDAANLIPARRRHQFLLGIFSEVWQRGKGKTVS